jgi:hypothetical protein
MDGDSLLFSHGVALDERDDPLSLKAERSIEKKETIHRPKQLKFNRRCSSDSKRTNRNIVKDRDIIEPMETTNRDRSDKVLERKVKEAIKQMKQS